MSSQIIFAYMDIGKTSGICAQCDLADSQFVEKKYSNIFLCLSVLLHFSTSQIQEYTYCSIPTMSLPYLFLKTWFHRNVNRKICILVCSYEFDLTHLLLFISLLLFLNKMDSSLMQILVIKQVFMIFSFLWV